MNKLNNKLGKEIPKGAGDKVDKFLKENINIIGISNLKYYVKLNFKNTSKLNTD